MVWSILFPKTKALKKSVLFTCMFRTALEHTKSVSRINKVKYPSNCSFYQLNPIEKIIQRLVRVVRSILLPLPFTFKRYSAAYCFHWMEKTRDGKVKRIYASIT